MRAELGLPSVRGDDEKGGGMMGGFGGSMGGVGGGKGKRPISVKFEIPYFTTSGIQVRYLKIIEPKVSRPVRLSYANVLTMCYSCNIHHCHGYDTSHNLAISLCDCRMYSRYHDRRTNQRRQGKLPNSPESKELSACHGAPLTDYFCDIQSQYVLPLQATLCSSLNAPCPPAAAEQQ
jgi:hypothetical protein